ncbi:Flap endonuclease GEN [Eumeta japonica]|uniref:Flap endonuclease GEN n=1 Tax=Eumeta variegata TaxID=151549 RepID=A0A4C1XM43_EUMVA|nr:Flap endonuclease GEN [Eumeta japonica]
MSFSTTLLHARKSRANSEISELLTARRMDITVWMSSLLFVGANNRRRGSAGRILGARRAGMRTHNVMLSYVCAVCRLLRIRARSAIDLAGTEDGVRDDGGGRATPGIGESTLKAGGPRSVQVCRSLKEGKGQQGSPNHLVDTVRTLYLLLEDVKPIFVLEGDAPELKKDVMAARNAIQFRGTASRANNNVKKPPDVARKRFKAVLRECESLLKCMGVSCIKGRGEAEATCAQLNSQVVSQDSDCFAYGARRVYRNFSVSGAAGGGAANGSVDVYDAEKMFNNNGFGRNKMIALALLCGCDYGVGACGTSIATVIGFLHTVPDSEIIPRLLSWVTDTETYEKLQHWVSVPGRCNRCGHEGRHKNGCLLCATVKGCNETGHKLKLTEVKRELSLRNRALTCGSLFPEPKVMNEFLNKESERIDPKTLMPGMPSLVSFVKLMGSKLEWPQRYCVEKFLPLLTRWHLRDNVHNCTIQPKTIKKKRNLKGVPSYEVVWEDLDHQYDGLIPDDQLEDGDPSSVWTTIERQDLMSLYYPKLVETYEESIKKPQKEKKVRSRKKKESNENSKPKRKYTKKTKKAITSMLENLHASVNLISDSLKGEVLNTSKINFSVNINKLKRKFKNYNLKSKTQKTIDSFVVKKRKLKSMNSLVDSLQNCSLSDGNYGNVKIEPSGNKENRNVQNPSLSFFDSICDEVGDQDLSDIVENIITKAPTKKVAKVNNDIVNLIFAKGELRKSGFRKSILKEMQNCSTPNQSPVRKAATNHTNVRTSYFFNKFTDEHDVFELSTDYKNLDDEVVLDYDQTMEYNYSFRDIPLSFNEIND